MEQRKQEKIELIKKSFELKHEKKYKDAIQTLYKVLELDNNLDDSIEILSQLGDLYVLIGGYDRTIDQFQKILSLNNCHEYAAQQCFEIYFKLEQYNKALKIATKMCENNKSTKSFYNYIKTLIALGKNQDAIEVFNNLDESLKMDADILYLIATISEDKRKIILERIVELDETHVNANIELAGIEFNNGNYAKVITYCLNLIDDHPIALYYLGKIEALRQNHTNAIKLLYKAIELDKDNNDFYMDLAKSYVEIFWLDEALMAIKKSINLSISKNKIEDLDEKYLFSGWILIKQHEYKKALMNLNSISKDSKIYQEAQILIQAINLNNSNTAKAVIELEEHIKNNKNNPILMETLALAYKELKQTTKAIAIYQKGLVLYPNSIYYTLELIDLLIDNKDYQQALKLIEKFSVANKNCPSIYNSLARIYYRLNDKQKALEAMEEFLKLDYNKAESHYFKGLILNDLEKYEEAKNSIYCAIKIDPRIAKYYSQMARSLVGLKEYDNALLYSKEAIEVDNNEINYKKQAYEIACLTGKEEQIQTLKRQLELSEKLLKSSR